MTIMGIIAMALVVGASLLLGLPAEEGVPDDAPTERALGNSRVWLHLRGVDDELSRRRRLEYHDVAAENVEQVRGCYAAEVDHQRHEHGRVALRVELNDLGAVQHVERLGPEGCDVGPCLAAAIETWRFPRPNGFASARFIYSFDVDPID